MGERVGLSMLRFGGASILFPATSGKASLATHPTENNLQTLSHHLPVPSWRGSCIPLRDDDTIVGHPASSLTPFGRAWKSPHPPNSN